MHCNNHTTVADLPACSCTTGGTLGVERAANNASQMPALPAGWQSLQSPSGAWICTLCLLALSLGFSCFQGYHKGMLGVNSATNFQQFQQLVSGKIPGLDPQQFNIVIVCSRAGAPEARQHIPIHENTVSAGLPCAIHAGRGHHAIRQQQGAIRARVGSLAGCWNATFCRLTETLQVGSAQQHTSHTSEPGGRNLTLRRVSPLVHSRWPLMLCMTSVWIGITWCSSVM